MILTIATTGMQVICHSPSAHVYSATTWVNIHCMQKTLLSNLIMSVESQKDTVNIQRCSVENQKGAINIQRCSVENQKGAMIAQYPKMFC